MNVLEQVALGWQCVWHTRREMLRAQLWGPWLVLLAAQGLVIGALAFAAHPWLSWFMAPLLTAVAHEDILRYPELLRRLPGLAAHAAALLGVVLAPLIAGVATRLFADRFRGARVRPDAAWGEALGRWFSLVLAAAPAALVALSVALLPTLLAGVRMSSLSRRLLPDALGVLGALLMALLLYTSALVMLERRGGLRALAELPRTWARGFVPALVVVAIVSLLRLPLERLAGASTLIVNRGIPELAIVLALTQALAAAVLGFVLTGAVTLAYLSVVATRDEDQP